MRRTILLADDSPTIQRLVTQIFADADFDIVSVSNGDAAIRKLEEVHPDIVLADIYMPGKNGYEVCAHIKNHPAMSRTPVILLVGALESFDEQTARQCRANANITKPFGPEALVELVTTVLENAAAEPIDETADESVAPPAVPESGDLLGLEALFKDEAPAAAAAAAGSPAVLADADIDRIADRAIEKLSAQLVEKIAWDVVPDIVEKTVREELKRKT